MSQQNNKLDNKEKYSDLPKIKADVLQDWNEAYTCENQFEETIRKAIVKYQAKLKKLCQEKNVKNPLEDSQISPDILVAVRQVKEAYNTILNKERNVNPEILSNGLLPTQEALMNVFTQYYEGNKEIENNLFAYLKNFKDRTIQFDQNYLIFDKAYRDVCDILDRLSAKYSGRFFIDKQTLSQVPNDLRLAEVLIDMHLHHLLVVKNIKTAAGKLVSIEIELLKSPEEIKEYIKPNHIEYLGVSMDLPDMSNVICNGKHIPFSAKRPHKELSFLKMLIENRDHGVVYNESLLATLNITKKRNKTSTDQKINIRNLQKERLRNLANELNKKLHKVSPNIKIIKDGDRYFLIHTDEI